MWKLYNFRAFRADAKAKLAEAVKATPPKGCEPIPDDVAAFMAAEIDRLPANVGMVKIDAHGQVETHKNETDVTRNAQITVVGVGA
jgi:hypothetical protein